MLLLIVFSLWDFFSCYFAYSWFLLDDRDSIEFSKRLLPWTIGNLHGHLLSVVFSRSLLFLRNLRLPEWLPFLVEHFIDFYQFCQCERKCYFLLFVVYNNLCHNLIYYLLFSGCKGTAILRPIPYHPGGILGHIMIVWYIPQMG